LQDAFILTGAQSNTVLPIGFATGKTISILIGQGKMVPQVCKELEISQHTYYRWRQKYGGMSPDMIKQHRALQKENTRLRSVIADQALDIAILKEATKLGN
jgi:putative transposase